MQMITTTSQFLSQYKKMFPGGLVGSVGHIINHDRLQRDYPDVDFITMVGFDKSQQALVLLKVENQEQEYEGVDNELSKREREVLQLVTKGGSNDQIARSLKISQNTVKVHLRHIFEKLGVQSRTEAAMYAVRKDWVQMTTNEM